MSNNKNFDPTIDDKEYKEISNEDRSAASDSFGRTIGIQEKQIEQGIEGRSAYGTDFDTTNKRREVLEGQMEAPQ